MSDLQEKLDAAVASGDLLTASRDNIRALLEATDNPVYAASVEELAAAGEWTELNDRFFRTLAFGTGGLRGRTIGRVVTRAERGSAGDNECPEHPCTGTNAMNYFNVSRALRGLLASVAEKVEASGEARRPRLVFCHDTRHFSREFATFCAQTVADLGGDAWLFEADRATPELSFAIRFLRADGGVMLTASHNPPHDNGFKAYFEDGAQIISPFADEVIARVNAIESDRFEPVTERGTVQTIGSDMDAAYMEALKTLVIDPDLLAQGTGPKVVFTNLHGTGGRIIPRLLEELGATVDTVADQDTRDGNFPTVKSPNPENAEALDMAVKQAESTGADLVVGTDPDCDRMGIAARDADGKIVLLTGNQTGSLLAYYRVQAMVAKGLLADADRERACLIKTFVTSRLQDAIARHYGISCVNTLTGFKYIAAKLLKYEQAIPAGGFDDYRELDESESRRLRLEHSRYFVFGGEESYGYLGHDSVRDKDGNGAVVMLLETTAFAMSRGLTLPGLLDAVFRDFGYFAEHNHARYFEGAEGAAKITRLADSYVASPPDLVDGAAVTSLRDFTTGEITDEEGERVPPEKMFIFDLDDGRSFAVRPSGTEPKIKYYLFGSAPPPEGKPMTAEELAAARQQVDSGLEQLWAWLEADVEQRIG